MFSLKRIQDRISSLFYLHGLFCASHPIAIIFLVIVTFSLICLPLTRLPLPGNAPEHYATPVAEYDVPPPFTQPQTGNQQDNVRDELPRKPRWYHGKPVAYIQQVIVKSIVSPWDHDQLIPSDAFRGPLHSVFGVINHINNHHDHKTSVHDICLHVNELTLSKTIKDAFIVKGMTRVLPQHACLLISPANLWNKDSMQFTSDGEIIKTALQQYGESLNSSPSVRDILFGVPWKDTGLKRYYIRNRQRLISYAVTLVFEKYDSSYIDGLEAKLQHFYPLSVSTNTSDKNEVIYHVHYKSINYLAEYLPLIVTYALLFMYILFSVSKIEMVKSKWGLALSAVITVIASLLISVSVCLMFGWTPSLSGSEIFPYLVVIIGLENNLVLTKSVTSTPVHLDVKLRVAQGLSKEGWYIFKNMIMELAVLTFGFASMVPAIQEFVLFAVVGLLSDFFLQMFFFATVLSIDIRRMELSDIHRQSIQHALKEASDDPSFPQKAPTYCPVMTRLTSSRVPAPVKIPKSSRPRPVSNSSPPSVPTPPATTQTAETSSFSFFRGWRSSSLGVEGGEGNHVPFRTPRRVRLLNFWAKTRIIQRAMMGCLVIWVMLFVYKTSLVDEVSDLNTTSTTQPPINSPNTNPLKNENITKIKEKADAGKNVRDKIMEEGQKWISTLMPDKEERAQWTKLAHNHWPTLFGYYNISLEGRYISILPPLQLSVAVTPQEAIRLRHSDEVKAASRHQRGSDWMQPNHSSPLDIVLQRLTRYPRTTLELVATVMFVISNVMMVTFSSIWLYKCMCTRRYHKWRPSWGKQRRSKKDAQYCKKIRESLPIVLRGHRQEVECLVTDGQFVVSSCLGGQIRVWDSATGEPMTCINRENIIPMTPPRSREPAPGRNMDDSDADLYAEFHETPKPFTPSSPPLGSSPPVFLNQTGGNVLSTRVTPSVVPPPPSRNRSSSIINKATASGALPKPYQHTRHKSADLAISNIMPDLSETVDTKFSLLSKLPSAQSVERLGYDFSQFDSLLEEHKENMKEKEMYQLRRKNSEKKDEKEDEDSRHSWTLDSTFDLEMSSFSEKKSQKKAPALWCLACRDNLIVAGCSNGRLEFWDGFSGHLKYIHHHNHIGITGVCFVGNKIIAARLNGSLDFLEIETFVNMHRPMNASPRATNSSNSFSRQSSFSSISSMPEMRSWDDILHVTLILSVHAHQQPILSLKAEGGRVLTASQDHTLKVYRLEDSLCLFTLHGHSAPVTTLYLDDAPPLAAISGSEDGDIRMWDLLTGACVHKLMGHEGSRVTCVTATQSHIISAGMDDRLCVWDRCKGHLLHWVQMEVGFVNCVSMLTNNLMLTGGQGSLYLWDIVKGEVLRDVTLGDFDYSIFVRQLRVINHSIVACDYGNQVCVVHFPSVLEKVE